MPDALPGLFLGQSDADQPESLLFNRANRHGVVAGATGTGKTVTLQIMAQGFSDAGVPVFCADVKGDLSGIAQVGTPNEKLVARATEMGLTLTPRAAPTVFWGKMWGVVGMFLSTPLAVMAMAILAEFKGSRWMAILLSGDGEPYADETKTTDAPKPSRRKPRPKPEPAPEA